MRSRLWYLILVALLGALVLAGCGVNPDAQAQPTGGASTGNAPITVPAAQAEPIGSTPIILPTPPPMPTSRPRPPTPTPPPAPAAPALAGASALAAADFHSGSDLSAWTVIDATEPFQGHAVWAVQDDRLQQVSAVDGDIRQYPTAFVTGDAAWQDYSVSAAAYNISNDEFGVVARAGAGGYYVFKLLSAQSTPGMVLERYDAAQGTFTTLATADSGGFEIRRWYDLRLQVQGDHLTAFVDGQPVLEARDTTLKQGRAGVSGYAMGGLEFDNFTVQALAASGQ
ncbi:MAG: family 16 glycoside hydrolase [Roseiflexaceae bacterium]